MRGICHLVIDLDDVPQGYSSIPGREGEREREREGTGERESETKRDKEVLRVPSLCIILHLMCSSQCEPCCLCVVRIHTPLMTHPKPRPARIQFESQVWRVQLRGTNAA